VTWVYLLTTTSARLLTFGELCHAVSPHSASFVTFVDTSPTTASVPGGVACALKTRLRQLCPGRASSFARHHHINCLFHHSGSQPSFDAHFQSLHRSSATHCHLTSNHPRLCPSSVNVFKHSFFLTQFFDLLRLRGLHDSSAMLAALKIFD